jgi:hypothetical protein
VQTLALQVVDAKNEPAARASALLLPMGGDEPVHELLSWTPLDAVGRVDLSVLRGRWFLFVTDDESSAAEVLEVGGDGPRRAHEMHLQPLPRMRGTVTKADGTPATGVRFSLNGWGTSNADRSPAERCLTTLLDDLDKRFLQRTRAAADGSYVLHFVLPPGSTGFAMATGPDPGASASFRLQPDGELELRLK